MEQTFDFDLDAEIAELRDKLHAAQDAIITLTTNYGTPDSMEFYSRWPIGVAFKSTHIDWQAIYDAHENRGSID